MNANRLRVYCTCIPENSAVRSLDCVTMGDSSGLGGGGGGLNHDHYMVMNHHG